MIYKFTPKKPVRSFQDLEVYRRTLECSVLIAKNIAPQAKKLGYPHTEQMLEGALSVPLWIAEAHSLRFADFALALGYLEKAMAGANKEIVYLDQLVGMYGQDGFDAGLAADLSGRYLITRGKMFRLGKAWRQYMDTKNSNP